MISVSRQSKVTNRSGFTLIEMAVVLVIVGIIVSIVASVLPSLVQSSKKKKAQAILEKADYTLQGYCIVNRRLPCADSSADGDEDDGIYVGNLPYRTLGLSSGTDVWGNNIKYAVYEDLTTTTRSNFCTTLNGITSYNDSSKIHTTDESTSQITNQAYIIVSGGAKDLDGDSADGFFDGLNEGSDVQFDDTNKIEFHGDPASSRYDDLMRAFSLNELVQKNCTGTSTGGDDTSEICDNGIDDDGDGYIDCDDQDCYGVDPCGAGGANVVITTSSIPSGVVNSDYSVTFQATGGTTPYEWTLDDKDGFTDLFLHTYTGQLSGTLDQCPGTYTIDVSVEDSTLAADDGPKTDTGSFSLQVTTNLVVSRTSGSGTNITWNSPIQQETFKATGGHLGDIDWALSTGGATGFGVSSSGSNTCTIAKNGATSAGSYTFTLTATDSSCSTNTASIILAVTVTSGGAGTPLSAHLVGHWKLDETSGTTAEDSSGQGNDGTLVNMDPTTDWVAGKINNALDFDGNNDYVNVGNDESLTPQNITISAWAKASRLDTWDGIVTNKQGANDGINLQMGTAQRIAALVGDGSAYNYIRSTTVPVVDKWYHIAITHNASGDNNILYVNGAKENEGVRALAYTPAVDTIIGRFYRNSLPFNGTIDDVRIYSKALSADEIYDLAGGIDSGLVAYWKLDESSGTTASDSSGNGHHGTLTNMDPSTDWVTGKINNALHFDGSNDHVQLVPSNDITGDNLQTVTVSIWVKYTSTTSQYPFSIKRSSSASTLISMVVNSNTSNDNSAGYLGFLTRNSADSAHSWLTYKLGSGYNDGNWHHLVAIVNGATRTLYIDGVQRGTDSDGMQSVTGNTYAAAIAAQNVGASPSLNFDGTIDDVRVYTRALSASEISTLYDMGN